MFNVVFKFMSTHIPTIILYSTVTV